MGGGKHNKGCCTLRSCELGEDDFERVDSTSLGSLWSEVSGDWEIDDGKLVCITPGRVTTTICHPAYAALGSFVARFRLANPVEGKVWQIRAGKPDSSPNIATVTLTSGEYVAELTNGTDTKTITWTELDDELDPLFTLCYFPGVQLSFQAQNVDAFTELESLDICIDDTDAGHCHSGLGNFSFLEGDYEDWEYLIHWGDNKNGECPYCECACIEGTGPDRYVRCWPDELTLTLIDPTDCPNIPSTYTLYARTEPGGDSGSAYAAPTITASTQKRVWVSDEIYMSDNDYYFRWKLDCDAVFGNTYEVYYPAMRLQVMFYVDFGDPWVIQTPLDHLGFDITNPLTEDILDITLNSRSHAIALPASTCDPIRLVFPILRETLLVFGGPIPYWCAPGGSHTSADIDGEQFTYEFEVEITE